MINGKLSRFNLLKKNLYNADGVHKVATTAEGRRRNTAAAKELSRLVWDITDAVLKDPLQTELHNLLRGSFGARYATLPAAHQFLYNALMNNDLDLVNAAAQMGRGVWGAVGGVSARDETAVVTTLEPAPEPKPEAGAETEAEADSPGAARGGAAAGSSIKSRRGKSRRVKSRRVKSRRVKSRRGKSRRGKSRRGKSRRRKSRRTRSKNK